MFECNPELENVVIYNIQASSFVDVWNILKDNGYSGGNAEAILNSNKMNYWFHIRVNLLNKRLIYMAKEKQYSEAWVKEAYLNYADVQKFIKFEDLFKED